MNETMKSLYIILLGTAILASCAFKSSDQVDRIKKESKESVDLQGLSKAYFAAGCFWCVEAIYESVEGVEEAISGYAGGMTENPTYESIGTGRTGHCETVEVHYDPDQVSYETLVKVFYGSHDPTTVNGQAPDLGTQYRSAIYYSTDEEKMIAEKFKKELEGSKKYALPIVTEIAMLNKFHMAEEYHQDYERLNPDQPYVKAVSVPRLNRFKKAFPELLKAGH